MGLLDNLKGKLGPAREKASGLAHRHGGTVGHGLDRAAKMVDEKTKHKYSDKIHSGTGKARHAMDRLAHKGGTGSGSRSAGTEPQDPPSAS